MGIVLYITKVLAIENASKFDDCSRIGFSSKIIDTLNAMEHLLY